ncbi:MAG: methionine--tRNA ligase [Candidatus Micrarchaeia archaeon]
MTEKILITSALPYANGPLHLGHVMSTYLPADTYARYCRLKGKDALYVCATDEHGTPIEINAKKAGKNPKDFTNQWHEKQAQDFANLGISFDEFYKTHSSENEELSKKFFEEHSKKDVVYKKKILQTYCENCKRFLPDRYIRGTCPHCKAVEQYGDGCEKCGKVYHNTDLENAKCAECGSTPVQKETEHWFFKLSSFSKFLTKWFSENKNLQSDVTNYLKNWIGKGLEDWDITRDGPYFGIKIPNEENKYFYVWYDAPIGYISSTKHYCKANDLNWEDYWKKDAQILHFIGKDIMYHHFLFWPAMLQSAGISLPTKIPTRGHMTLQGEKMSKSRGRFILLSDFLSKYKPDYLRYYFTAITPTSISDADFSWTEFQSKVNNELVDSFGNYAFRVLSFLKTKYDSTIPKAFELTDEDKAFEDKINKLPTTLEKEFDEVKLKEALEKAMLFVGDCNKYFNDRAPWKLLKENKKTQADTTLHLSLKALHLLAVHLYPILPFSCEELLKQLNLPKSANQKWGELKELKEGEKLNEPKILFHKIEDEQIQKETEKLKEN